MCKKKWFSKVLINLNFGLQHKISQCFVSKVKILVLKAQIGRNKSKFVKILVFFLQNSKV